MSTTVVFDATGAPRTTLTRDGDFWQAVLEVEGLDPQRGTSSEERASGITSLFPPTVRIRAKRNARDTHRTLIAAAKRAVLSSATSTTGETGGPRGMLMTHLRVARGMRGALRLAGEDI